MSFYRTYRPQVIEEIDNPSVREQLTSLLSKDRKDLPHAFFFTGPKGTGKTTAARVIAKLFNCEKPTKAGPCGTCDQCISIAKGSSLDVIEMDAASNRGIDEIRTLRDRINLSPASSNYTVYIIDEVHMLTTEAFNALLKTLEEPPSHAVFVLATTDSHKVPETITSRCVPIRFQRAGLAELTHVIIRIAKEEKISIDDEAVALIADAADGSFRDAAKLLEQVSFQRGKITKAVVQKILSLSDEKIRDLFLHHMAKRNTKEALAVVSQLVIEGRDVKSFMSDIMNDLHAKLVAVAQGQDGSGWAKDELIDCIKRLTVAFGELRVSPIQSLPLELVVVEFCSSPYPIPHTPLPSPKSETPTDVSAPSVSGLLTLDKLTEHWPDFIAALKPYNHSVAGVLRSSRPKSVKDGIVTIEAFYKFHQEKLNDTKTRQILSDVLKKLFGEKVKVEIVLGKK
ncbi:MAG TPA: DNA polymerase III subunit gamma/tau [Patescibacteria group bacterium]|nr:DNA polymerase III subunit gamma/tau [Patescibacteria group bacterium]